jgi:hypothetical protein
LLKMALLTSEDLRSIGLLLGPRLTSKAVPVGPKPLDAESSDLLEETLPQRQDGA